MLTDNEIKDIIVRYELHQDDCLEVIRRYIYDLKNKDVGRITISSQISLSLMNIAYNKCVEYYTNKLINDKES